MTPRRTVVRLCSLVVAMVMAGMLGGFVVYNNASSDPLGRADVIVVLGGEHDGREKYGLHLAQMGWAPVVLLSNPYGADDPVMHEFCGGRIKTVEVLCERPNPLTTRGEALMTYRLASQRSWRTILVVSWRYHLPRARYVFSRCDVSAGLKVIAHEVPRSYSFSPFGWAGVYLYQTAGFVKAWAEPRC